MMRPPTSLFLILFFAMASSQVGAQATNLGLSGTVCGVRDELFALLASESADGVDYNLDGDTFDNVLHLYDARTGELLNLGFARSGNLSDDLWNEELLALTVSELNQGSQDLNGDGDAEDELLYLYDVAARRSIGFVGSAALSTELVQGRYVAYLRDEDADDGADWNGDGDTTDEVAFLYDAVAATSRNTGLATIDSLLAPSNDQTSFLANVLVVTVDELAQGNTDLDGDGEVRDGILFVYDLQTGAIENTGEPSLLVSRAGPIAAVSQNERPGDDMNGDGDRLDRVAKIYDPLQGTLTNTRTAASTVDSDPRAHGAYIWSVSEADQSADLNGDGDKGLLEEIAFVYDRSTGQTTNLGVTSEATHLAYPWAFVLSRETWEGVSLNGDKDQRDSVLHVTDLRTTETTNTGLASSSFDFHLFGQGMFAIRVGEFDQGDTDLNGDGDMDDFVLHIFDGTSGSIENTGRTMAGSSFLPAVRWSGGRFVYVVSEASELGTDLNSDGDTGDDVASLYDPCTGEFTSLSFAVLNASRRFAFTEDTVLLAALEAGQGADLNGDGDLLDEVFHVVDVAPATSGFARIGAGTPGTSGFVPELQPLGCPVLGDDMGLQVLRGLESAPGLLVVGDTPVDLPLFGGSLYVLPFEVLSPFVLDGSLGQAGSGEALLTFAIDDPALVGLTLYTQAGILDPGAAGGLALTAALAVTFGG